MNQEEIIIGIDPGTLVTGFGIIKVENRNVSAIDFGCIRPPPKLLLSDRYWIISQGVERLIEKHGPSEISVETQFVQKNSQSAIKLGMARGAIIVAAKRHGIAVAEYTPATVKKAVTGNGRASKYQVQGMTQRLLNLSSPPSPEDASDALAIAICHSQAKIFKALTANYL